MNDQLKWNHFFNEGRSGGDMPGFGSSLRVWDAYELGKQERAMQRDLERMQRQDWATSNVWPRTYD